MKEKVKAKLGDIVLFRENGVEHPALVLRAPDEQFTVALRVFKVGGGERMIPKAPWAAEGDETWSARE